jgi:flagellar motor switch protein FliN/FliY
VTETIEYEQFEQGGQGDGSPTTTTAVDVDLSRLSDIPMELSVEIGRTHMTVGETLDLRVGSVVALERLSGETADLLVNGTAIARGEVVVIDEQYGLRITEILDAQPDAEHAQPDAEHAQPDAEHAQPDAEHAQPDAEYAQPDAPATEGEEPETEAQQEPAAVADESESA